MLDVSLVNPDGWKDKQEITAKAQQEEAFIEIHLFSPTIGIRQSRNTPLNNYNWNSTKSKYSTK